MAILPNRRTIVRREALICSASIVTLLLFPVVLSAQIVDLCDRSASTTVMGGEYNVMNNVWGSGAGVGNQCLEVNTSSSYFKVSQSTHNSSSVASYPAIFKGCHWGWCTTNNNPMPIPVWEIGSAPFTWTIRTDSASGTWNAALDIWFDDTLSFADDYDLEMMIWIDYHGGATPAGSRQGTVQIGGLMWDVYFTVFANWPYVAYKITSPVDSVNLDLRDFINDSVTRGYLNTTWYLHAIEAGFEIWRGGQSLTTRSFSADVVRTASAVGAELIDQIPHKFFLYQNYPNPFNTSTEIIFEVETATDLDLSVFNVLGERVKTLTSGFRQPGRYRATFDASGLPSGVYYYQLKTPSQDERRSCVYLK
jgi:cellulose 1,4-beta-cellobiosidase